MNADFEQLRSEATAWEQKRRENDRLVHKARIRELEARMTR